MTGVRRHSTTSADGTRIGYQTVGAGWPLVVVGGVLRSAEDYLPLAIALADRFQVHVVDRRGRGASGPQGDAYGIHKEREDLQAILTATGATAVFGHSYGGLVALETAKEDRRLRHLALYEPGVSVGGSLPTDWMPDYRHRLEAGDRRGAFACLARGSGHAPPALSRMPIWMVKVALRAGIRPSQWRRMDALLEANLAEHEEVRRLDDTHGSYGEITADALLLRGSQSPPSSRLGVEALAQTLPNVTVDVLHGLRHDAPDGAAPRPVADRIGRFFEDAKRYNDHAARAAAIRP